MDFRVVGLCNKEEAGELTYMTKLILVGERARHLGSLAYTDKLMEE